MRTPIANYSNGMSEHLAPPSRIQVQLGGHILGSRWQSAKLQRMCFREDLVFVREFLRGRDFKVGTSVEELIPRRGTEGLPSLGGSNIPDSIAVSLMQASGFRSTSGLYASREARMRFEQLRSTEPG
jgi:hypothetical protein